MDIGGPQVTVRTSISFLLLVLLQTSMQARVELCSGPEVVNFPENNTVGEVVANITTQEGVEVNFKSPPPADNPFSLNNNINNTQLIADRVLDFEVMNFYTVELICTQTATGKTFPIEVHVLLIDVNENPPVFVHDPCLLEVKELSAVDTLVGSCPATDADPSDRLYYMLSPESEGFKMQTSTSPNIVVQTPLDYDKVKTVTLKLYVQDTPLPPADVTPSFTASSTVLVTITDIDNRPPWFQPCTKYEVAGAVICQNAGYTGNVTLNELEVGALPLKPGPLYAIDGDSGINEEITYTILSGSDRFAINSKTGNISMLKAADSLTPISLTVVATQKSNSFQSAAAIVNFRVLVKSLHPPQFEKPRYDGVVSAMGNMVMDLNNEDQPLQILARDEDYAATGGLNPHVAYKTSSNFSLINGYLFMVKNLPAGTFSLQVEAVDTTNDESATSEVTVKVTPGLSSTTAVPSTTDVTDTPTGETATTTSITTDSIISTSDPATTPEGSVSPTKPVTTPEEGAIDPSGDFRSEDMVALGATLGVLLFVCLLIIGLLVCRIQRGKADWRKVYEANVFRSALGQSSSARKEGIQFTNEAFQNDDDDGGSSSGSKGQMMTSSETAFPLNDAVLKSAVSLHTVLGDDTSQVGSEKTDDEKEVKPILTKERRVEDGYKAVWFKEDIDPDAKEEVVIIPDSRDDEDEEEEEEEQSSSGREEDEDDGSQMKIPKVVFADTDLDSGLGVKMEDPAEDSEDDNALTASL
ncbi:hypothetical protein LDENG_00088440 [Lucifuga dentata]|nr:hypothetical protein LDENG_00088440 [Lucifuga dentata]